jgi:hypothetical protein
MRICLHCRILYGELSRIVCENLEINTLSKLANSRVASAPDHHCGDPNQNQNIESMIIIIGIVKMCLVARLIPAVVLLRKRGGIVQQIKRLVFGLNESTSKCQQLKLFRLIKVEKREKKRAASTSMRCSGTDREVHSSNHGQRCCATRSAEQ